MKKMEDKTIMALGESLGRIAKLETASEEAEHTDIGDIWDVLRFAQNTLRLIVSETIGDDDDEQDALDERIHDHFSAVASDLNNRGADAQRAFLAQEDRGEYVIDPPGDAKKKIDKVCTNCGGSVLFEGWISWDVEAQDFVVNDICDKGHTCDSCNGTTYAIDIEYKPLSLVIEFSNDEPANFEASPKERTYRFNTQTELVAFREGLVLGDCKFEITYTDEESDEGS